MDCLATLGEGLSQTLTFCKSSLVTDIARLPETIEAVDLREPVGLNGIGAPPRLQRP